ncbi:C-C motif chemokine 4 homolog [Clarias gariepinus]|uniref:C-C motif chemokine 4 homolog n=1 Tax=Clarias gariepinus TaxID=13013 RepID=UPI00234D81EE|nr:C-C motif chemokine 4 homolog [Clarias gariepinus]
MSSCSLPLVLLVLICVQSFTLALAPNAPDICCFTFQKRKVPVQLITKYDETYPSCPNPGIIFTMKSGRRVCADPRDQWVKDHMNNIDLRLYGGTNQTQASG